MDELISNVFDLKTKKSKNYKYFILGNSEYCDYANMRGWIEGIYESGIIFKLIEGGLDHDLYYETLVIIKDGCEPLIIDSAWGMCGPDHIMNAKLIEKTKKELGQRIDEKVRELKYKKGLFNKTIVSLKFHKLELLVLKYFDQWNKNKENLVSMGEKHTKLTIKQ